MIGIVLVSHSQQLANGVRELAAQMTQYKVPLAVAAGIDDPEHPFGTDVMKVYEAIASVYSDEGVLVFMDLGSSLMSAEMALEFLSDEQRSVIQLCDAPLVEGAIAAAVAVATGSDMTQVIAEAKGALAAKTAHLTDIRTPGALGRSELPDSSLSSEPSFTFGQDTHHVRVVIRNQLGLHARPAAQFVTTAATFQATIQIRNLTKQTSWMRADSMNQVAMLQAEQGDELAIAAHGIDATTALTALQALVEANFGEEDILEGIPELDQAIASSDIVLGRSQLENFRNQSLENQSLENQNLGNQIRGIPASPGIAIAPLIVYRSNQNPVQWLNHSNPNLTGSKHSEIRYSEIANSEHRNPGTEWHRVQIAIETVQRDIQNLRSKLLKQMSTTQVAIFDSHILFLSDPVLLESVYSRIFKQRQTAEAAWQQVIQGLVESYRQLDAPYLRERAIDVADVGQRVWRYLINGAFPDEGCSMESLVLNLDQPSILIALDLTPSDTVQLDPVKVLGICTALGSAASHSAILARTLGIPAVVGLGSQVLDLLDGTVVALDGATGEVWIVPDSGILAELYAKQQRWQTTQYQMRQMAQQAAMTRDRHPVPVLANIAGVADAQAALVLGAEGVGLLRTEFLFLDRKTAPSEAEQLAVYQSIAQVMGTLPLMIRTLDVGGDKPLPYLNQSPEPNPFLGDRGIRFCLNHLKLFKTQIRAILQASAGHAIKILFPMVATLSEIRAAKAIVHEVQAELRQAGIVFDPDLPIGIMVEVPAAVAIADQLAAEVAFFSIGTNDLSQYVMAADRTNPQVGMLADALQPAVLRMIQQTIQVAHRAGIKAGVCGELAADPLAIPILLGLGVDEISLSAPAIPKIKQTITQLTMDDAKTIAAIALQQESAIQVREVVVRAMDGD